MERSKQEATTTFAEVFASSGIQFHQSRGSSNDTRPMLYFQGMKLYIPDGFNPETLLTLLHVLKQL